MPISQNSSLRLALAGMLALALAMGLGRFAQTPILPFMIDELAWSKSEAGYLASANFFGYLAGCLILGFIPLQVSKNRFLASVFFSVTATLAMSLSGDLLTLSVLRFFSGLASATTLVLASSLILARLDAGGRPELGGLLFAGVGFGIALSALLTGTFGHWGYRWLWTICGIAATAGLLAIILLMPADQVTPKRIQATKPTSLRRLAILLPAYGLVGFGYVITATFISTMLRETPALQHLETEAWLVVGLAGAPSIWFWTQIARRTKPQAAYALACLVEAIGVTLAVTTTSTTLILLSAAMLGGTFMGLTAMGLARARLLIPERAQAAIAFMSAAFAMGQMVGPAFAGILADMTSSLLVPSLVAALGLCLSAVLALLPDPQAQSEARPL